MSPTEQAARHLLGDFNQPDVSVRELLGELSQTEYLSEGERALIDMASQIYGTHGRYTLNEALRALDSENRKRLVESLQILFRVAA